MKYRFRKSVWGTKKFYSDLKQGQMSEYWKNPTGYGELMKMDPQLVFCFCLIFFSFWCFWRKLLWQQY